MEFTQEELSRYNRQMRMEGWGQETQEKIKRSTVFIAAAGWLGSPVCDAISLSRRPRRSSLFLVQRRVL